MKERDPGVTSRMHTANSCLYETCISEQSNFCVIERQKESERWEERKEIFFVLIDLLAQICF